MGFNISGVVINKNFDKNIEKFANTMGFKLKFQYEMSFEEASENWTPDNECKIYFSETGTLAFTSMERVAFSRFKIPDANVLTFAYSETAMAFNLQYFENGEMTRSIMAHEGNRMRDRGEKLELEKEGVTQVDDLIFKMIDKTLGQRFFDIEGETAYYCLFQ